MKKFQKKFYHLINPPSFTRFLDRKAQNAFFAPEGYDILFSLKGLGSNFKSGVIQGQISELIESG